MGCNGPAVFPALPTGFDMAPAAHAAATTCAAAMVRARWLGVIGFVRDTFIALRCELAPAGQRRLSDKHERPQTGPGSHQPPGGSDCGISTARAARREQRSSWLGRLGLRRRPPPTASALPPDERAPFNQQPPSQPWMLPTCASCCWAPGRCCPGMPSLRLPTVSCRAWVLQRVMKPAVLMLPTPWLHRYLCCCG